MRYLYYIPRPPRLSPDVAGALFEIVQREFGGHIFDFKFGERLKTTLEDTSSSLYAGIVVASPRFQARTLAEVYSGLLMAVTPFSWDLPMRLGLDRGHGFRRHRGNGHCDVICGVVSGDKSAAEEIYKIIGTSEIKEPKILPTRTVTIQVWVGRDYEGEPIEVSERE